MAISRKLPILTIYTGDTAPTFEFTVTNTQGTAVNLTGASVECHLRAIGATANVFSASAEACTVTNPSGGVCTWSLPTNGVMDPGVYYGQLEAQLSGGRGQHTQRFQVEIHEGL